MRKKRVLRVLGRGLIVLVALFLVPGVEFLISARSFASYRYAPPAAKRLPAVAPPVHAPGKPTVAIVVGNAGANVADTLVPYDVLASTGKFNVYTVAPERRPLPLLGGLDLVPDVDFVQLSRRLDGRAPDVTVVPEMPSDKDSDRRVIAWLRSTASRGLVMSVCTGARLVADAGLLDGREATTHWYRLSGLQDAHPAVHWRRGVRYLDDGNVITTGGLLSSVDGTLRVIERLAGADTAAAAARTVGWRHYSPGVPASMPKSRLSPSNAIVHLLNLGYRSRTSTVGVVLTDGVGELELASVFSPYAEVKAARTVAIASTATVRSRHGLTFVPRARLDGAGDDVDRLMVPGTTAAANPDPEIAAAARRAGVPLEYPHRQPGFAFDPVLRSMARTFDRPTARWTSKILEYRSADLGPSGPSWPWTPTLRLALLGLVGVAALAVVRITARLITTGSLRSRTTNREADGSPDGGRNTLDEDEEEP
ncbi:DJ-1/PfpI family protein [Actinomadura opuntiae]|uniref:DJ-1/PfpI family protein n=1 Tax=Actinomadura sp. OS1-43 TaxID=604315 RepID=UPI00255B0C5C|nr:DJ-1/PfpI family protein [Actinomadura sp. OS1-43]MDL4816577.1 DJ-1/PfpI family protein [Actinomadura sp. OS1-43]